MMPARWPILLLAVSTLVACGRPSVVEATLGRPAAAAEAEREVTIAATSALRFVPDDITVSPGETVTFVVTNPSPIQHEFVIGNAELQEEHNELLKSSHVNLDAPYAIDLPPGETREITWHFTEQGRTLFACHIGIPAHSFEGMVGTISVGE